MKIDKLKVKLTLTTPMLGTKPKNKEIYSQFILNELRNKLNKGEITKEEFKEKEFEEIESVKEVEEKGWTGFLSDSHGIFVNDYMIRGFLKNAGDCLKDQLKLKNVKSKVDKFVFIFPRKIYFLYGKDSVKKPHGVEERSLRAQTMQGPRVTLAKSDFLQEGCYCNFEVEIIDNSREISQKIVKELFNYGKYCGLGQFRNGSYGRFEVEFS